MPGKATAVHTGNDLVQKVVALAHQLGLESRTQVAVGRRLWGALRKIDVVLTHPETRRTLGVECKFQGTKGSAEEKIPINDSRPLSVAHSRHSRLRRKRLQS